ncbi:hypothetical protein AVEN_121653-1, partial [Araneus ventricosus]
STTAVVLPKEYSYKYSKQFESTTENEFECFTWQTLLMSVSRIHGWKRLKRNSSVNPLNKPQHYITSARFESFSEKGAGLSSSPHGKIPMNSFYVNHDGSPTESRLEL